MITMGLFQNLDRPMSNRSATRSLRRISTRCNGFPSGLLKKAFIPPTDAGTSGAYGFRVTVSSLRCSVPVSPFVLVNLKFPRL